MKKSQGFTIIEVLIASAIGLITLGVIYGAYQVGWKTFQFNQKRMDVINKLSLSMDRIKKEAREGKKFIDSENFPVSIPNDSLVFTTDDTTDIAFYFKEDGNGQFHLCKKVSADPYSEKVVISFDPGIEVNPEPPDISYSSADITLTAKWSYRGEEKSKSISSVIHLRNWERY